MIDFILTSFLSLPNPQSFTFSRYFYGKSLRKNQAELQDDYFSYKPGGKKRDLIEISRYDNRLSIESNPFNAVFCRCFLIHSIAATFLKDNISKSYDRSVITLLDVFGNVGGIMGIISVFGAMIVGFVSSKTFIYSILSKLYHVEEPENLFNGEAYNLNHL